MDKDALARAAAKAAARYGLITWDELLEAGMSPDVTRRLVAEGQLTRVARGIYRMIGVKPTWRGRMMAACLQAGDGAVVSHRSAAAVWGLEGFEPPRIVDLTVPPNRRPRIEQARVHRRAVTGRAVRDGIPLTPIPETILDLCAVSRNHGIPLRALDDVRRRKLATSAELERCLAEHAGRKAPGIPLYRSLLTRRLGPDATGDGVRLRRPRPLARRRTARARGRVLGHDQRAAVPDRPGLPRPKIAIECLGKIGHQNERSFEEDPVRNNDLALDGWLQIQVTWLRRVERPATVVADVEEALARRGGA